jgi:hypothetical protein
MECKRVEEQILININGIEQNKKFIIMYSPDATKLWKYFTPELCVRNESQEQIKTLVVKPLETIIKK